MTSPLNKRHIQLAGSSNLRDIGGYTTADGRTVRWGQVYRSGALFRFTPTCWDWVIEHRIETVCDLRAREEQMLAPTVWQGGVNVRHIGVEYDARLLFARSAATGNAGVNEMHDASYGLFPKLLAPSFKAMLQALLGCQMPLLVHCSAGQDRTGVAIGLLLEILGVPRDVILEDYHLSTACRRTENELDQAQIRANAPENLFARYYVKVLERRGNAAMTPRPLVNREGQSLLLEAFKAIETQWGSVPVYLGEALGLTQEQVSQLKNICLTPM